MSYVPVILYDTTLRDGTQGENITLSLADKLRIARMLDEFGMPYIDARTGAPALHALSGFGLFRPGFSFFLPDTERRVTVPGINLPGATALVRLDNRCTLDGGDVNGMGAIGVGPVRIGALAGARYLGLDEELTLEAQSLRAAGTFTTIDTFKTRNDFYGVWCENGSGGVADSPSPGRSGAITVNRRDNGSTLRTQCIHEP